ASSTSTRPIPHSVALRRRSAAAAGNDSTATRRSKRGASSAVRSPAPAKSSTPSAPFPAASATRRTSSAARGPFDCANTPADRPPADRELAPGPRRPAARGAPVGGSRGELPLAVRGRRARRELVEPILERGHEHRAAAHRAERVRAPAAVADAPALDVDTGATAVAVLGRRRHARPERAGVDPTDAPERVGEDRALRLELRGVRDVLPCPA